MIVDVEQDTRFVPDSIKGERVLFVAVGSVDAGVSFTGLDESAVEVSNDRSGVSIELPPATFREPELDLDRSYVYDRDRGAIDRIQSLLGDDTGVEPELFTLAEEKLTDAARDGSGLLARAERNTRLMLDGPAPRARLHPSRRALLRGLAEPAHDQRRIAARAPRDHDRVVEDAAEQVLAQHRPRRPESGQLPSWSRAIRSA